jgi:hypothetical protein
MTGKRPGHISYLLDLLRVMAAVLAAGLDGLKNKIEPPPETQGIVTADPIFISSDHPNLAITKMIRFTLDRYTKLYTISLYFIGLQSSHDPPPFPPF